MKIAVCVKVVPDDQDITVASDRTLDSSKAHQVVSEYDLNAIEAAAQLAAANDAQLVAISASNARADDLKVKKSILSRGPEELFMIADDALALADARTTARVLASLLEQAGDCDLVVCGDGSADLYAGQVDVQLAALLDRPVVNAVTAMKIEDGTLVVERTLDDLVEEIELPLPAVVAVSPDIALPRIAGMREILAAGKKPATVSDASSAGIDVTPLVETLSVRAPELADRKRQVFDMKTDGDFDSFAAAVAAALR
ncbi:MAG: electron transfer flavoprotein [Gordonibacter sp.]|uniref:electron transfer flavoprotein n=1 Tax=Gordonibacter sp. TaxID=1968902 RepID=UPI002FCBA0AA